MLKRIKFFMFPIFAIALIAIVSGCSDATTGETKADKLSIDIGNRSASWYLDMKAQDPDYFKGYLICKWQLVQGQKIFLKVEISNGNPILTYGAPTGAYCQWEFIPVGSRYFIKCLSPALNSTTYSYYLAGGIQYTGGDDDTDESFDALSQATVVRVSKADENKIFNGQFPSTWQNIAWDLQNHELYGGNNYYNFHMYSDFAYAVVWNGYQVIGGNDQGYLNIESLWTNPLNNAYDGIGSKVQMGYVPWYQYTNINYTQYHSNKWRILWLSDSDNDE